MRNCTRLKEREGKTEVQRPWSCGTSTVTKWKEEMKAFKKKKKEKEESETGVNQNNGALC